MRFRSWAATVAAGIMCASVASGCSKSAGTEKTGTEDADQGTEPAHLVIHSMSGWTEEAFNERFGDAIRKKFPMHTFTYIQSAKGSTYPDLIAAGQQIDIVWESIGLFPRGPLPYKLQYDMTERIKLHQIDTSRIEPTLIAAIKEMSGGGMYALPVINNTVMLYYNKDLFDTFGVAYPKNGMTWDEALALNERLTRSDGAVQYAGLGLGHFFATNSFSLPYVDPKTEKPTIANAEWKALYQIYMRMAEPQGFKDKMRQTGKIPDVASFVKHKDTAMLAALANTHMNQDMSGLNWDAVPFPVFKEKPNTGPQSYPTYFGVTATSQHKEQAMETIKFLLSDEYQMEASRKGVLPVVKSDAVKEAFAKDTPFAGKNVKAAFYDNFAPVSPRTIYDGEVEKAYNAELVKLMLGEVDLNTLLRNAEEAAGKAIAELKK
ncbi:ABC transporter substrate-binding protein [Paenibacillus sp. GYB003]|uniref:ABC transporter substrate-binding protein n=1 Tax=Paenibacillus sp. GYB003 TaxID=2994392 RepID=UPI002F96B031